MKLIVRADDLGFSEAINYGIEKSVRSGVVTSVGMMPNMEYAKIGYELIKDYNIAIGMHSNICVGKPIADTKLIPSLVQENGMFCTSKEIRQRKADLINIQECEVELEAQLKRFVEITGRLPDYFEGHAVFSDNYFIALQNVAKKHKLFYAAPGLDKECEKEHGIYGFGFAGIVGEGLYDPQKYMEERYENIKDKPCGIAIFHPGYLDQYILKNSSFTLIRPMETEFLCSDWLKEWIAVNEIELVDFRMYK